MFFCSAKHNRFCHTVIRLFQVVGYFLSYLCNAVFDYDIVIVIAVIVDTVFYQVSMNIFLSFTWSPFITDIGFDIDYPERCKESVVNAFTQAVGINRLPKIINIGYVFRFLGSRSHTDLDSTGKVFQNLSPVTVLLGRTAMAFVNDN